MIVLFSFVFLVVFGKENANTRREIIEHSLKTRGEDARAVRRSLRPKVIWIRLLPYTFPSQSVTDPSQRAMDPSQSVTDPS